MRDPSATAIHPAPSSADRGASSWHRAGSDIPFFVIMGGVGGSYVVLIVALLAADIAFTSPRHFATALS
jgi:hypothetical protein